MTYAEKLKDPRWQKMRLEVLQRDSFTCKCCSSAINSLQVHHAYYLPKINPWDYPAESLTTLCEKCHNEQTARIPRLMMQNKTPESTMINTELLELANSSPRTMGIVMELALALSLSDNGEHIDADLVMRPVMDNLNDLMGKMEERGWMSTR